MNKDFDWIISNEILLEYEEKTADFYSLETAELVIAILSTASNVTFAEPFIKWALITDDPDDNKFADLAISANVHYLVSNDRHFNVMKSLPFPSVKVVTMTEFQEIMGY
jgi:predicted nucleic acid-binding protein